MNSPEVFDYHAGQGFDVHAIENVSEPTVITLCGIKIPASYKIIAHSDGDVILHAIVDALLGAIGAGDIGEHFPPSDAQWRNVASSLFVEHALQLAYQQQALLINVDVTLICEQPKISAYKMEMKKNLASLLKLSLARINIKATTTENCGFLGRSEGIAALAIVSLKIPQNFQ